MELNYFWSAVYKDGTILRQFSDEQENLFSDIDQSQLKEFQIGLKWAVYSPTISVDLETGCFCVVEQKRYYPELGNNDFRLIYFRRNQATPEGGITKITHCIGLQTTVNGANKKTIYEIDNETHVLEVVTE
ncbi:MAG: hypothetical protein Q8O88_01295 [bacterium]|nr:hypothetical protein [bacterium]